VASEQVGLRSQFRRALQIALAAHFTAAGLELEFEGGTIEGPQERDIGCVWIDTVRPHRADWNNEEAFFGVRVLRAWKQDQGGEQPRTLQEERLEWTLEILEDGLVAVLNRPLLEAASGLVLTGWADYFIVQEVVLDHQAQHVTATIAMQARSRTRRGG